MVSLHSQVPARKQVSVTIIQAFHRKRDFTLQRKHVFILRIILEKKSSERDSGSGQCGTWIHSERETDSFMVLLPSGRRRSSSLSGGFTRLNFSQLHRPTVETRGDEQKHHAVVSNRLRLQAPK